MQGRLRGRLLVWTDVRGGGSIGVRLDSVPVGTLSAYYSRGAPTCRDPRGALLLRLRPGTYAVRADDEVGRQWRTDAAVSSVLCRRIRLTAVGGRGDAESIPADSGTMQHTR